MLKLLKFLISATKIDVNIKTSNPSCKEHRTPLHLAVLMKNIEIIKLLLNHDGIDINAVNKDGKKPIDYTDDDEIKKLINEKST